LVVVVVGKLKVFDLAFVIVDIVATVSVGGLEFNKIDSIKKDAFMEQNCFFTSPVRMVGGLCDVPSPSPGSAKNNLTTKSSPAFYRTPTTKVHCLRLFLVAFPSFILTFTNCIRLLYGSSVVLTGAAFLLL